MKYMMAWAALVCLLGCRPLLVFENDGVRVWVQEDPEQYRKLRFDQGASDDYGLLSAEVEQDTLQLYVNYGGGCGEVDFTLWLDAASQTNSDTLVSRAAVLVLGDADNCEALLTIAVPIPLNQLPLGPFTLFVYNPSDNGEAVTVYVP